MGINKMYTLAYKGNIRMRQYGLNTLSQLTHHLVLASNHLLEIELITKVT